MSTKFEYVWLDKLDNYQNKYNVHIHKAPKIKN